MTFKNQKEEVMEIELTSYGKHLLSKGKFRPSFYAFFDDDIVYDSGYTGAAEEQNYAQTRILEQTPRLRVQTIYTSLEREIESQIEESRTGQKKLKESFQATKEKHYALSTPLGRSSPTSDNAPSWDVTLHGAKFQQQLIADSAGGKQTLQIPQMNLETLEYKVSIIANDGAHDHNSAAITDEGTFQNNTAIRIEHRDIILEIDELHTDSLSENYDIEIFVVEEAVSGEEVLLPLRFPRDTESGITDGMYTDDLDDFLEEEVNETSVLNHLRIYVDSEIDASDLCRLGYQTDFSKRGHIKVNCDEYVDDSDMNKIYDNIDSVPPFGEDC
jgi:hypothetical protein